MIIIITPAAGDRLIIIILNNLITYCRIIIIITLIIISTDSFSIVIIIIIIPAEVKKKFLIQYKQPVGRAAILLLAHSVVKTKLLFIFLNKCISVFVTDGYYFLLLLPLNPALSY